MVEVEVQPGNGPPPHIHHREDETFYVLDGNSSFLHGEHTFGRLADRLSTYLWVLFILSRTWGKA
jgi:oxalate decarboxylase/phosphoglucose isomerase-like protein (cupin superfamily)